MKHCHDILLADANEVFCGLLQESIALRENYRVVRTKKGWDILRLCSGKTAGAFDHGSGSSGCEWYRGHA